MSEDGKSFNQDAYEEALAELYEAIDDRPRMLYGITQVPARQILADNAAYMAALNKRSVARDKDASPDESKDAAL
jgi:hypothetical protein